MLNNIKPELVELNDMVGMKSLKETIFYQIMYFIQSCIYGERLQTHGHLRTAWNGETEIAKIIGRMYSNMGILKRERSKGFAKRSGRRVFGSNRDKTKQVTDCLGCLFIDEVYSLSSPDKKSGHFFQGVYRHLVRGVERTQRRFDGYYGYEEEIKTCFFKANDGLEGLYGGLSENG
jgi:hypothetical protein